MPRSADGIIIHSGCKLFILFFFFLFLFFLFDTHYSTVVMCSFKTSAALLSICCNVSRIIWYMWQVTQKLRNGTNVMKDGWATSWITFVMVYTHEKHWNMAHTKSQSLFFFLLFSFLCSFQYFHTAQSCSGLHLELSISKVQGWTCY